MIETHASREQLAQAGYRLPAAFFPSEPEAKPAAKDELPEDFPGREHLVAAGLTTVEAVAAKSDEELLALDGIGEKTVEKIREALK